MGEIAPESSVVSAESFCAFVSPIMEEVNILVMVSADKRTAITIIIWMRSDILFNFKLVIRTESVLWAFLQVVAIAPRIVSMFPYILHTPAFALWT